MMVLMPAMVGCAGGTVVLCAPASVLGMRRVMRWVAGRIDRPTSLKLELSLRSACLGCRELSARTHSWRDPATGASYLIDAYPPAHHRPKTHLLLRPLRPNPFLPAAILIVRRQSYYIRSSTSPPSQQPSLLGHHVQKQLRQRLGYVLAAGPYLPGGICIRSGQARFGGCRHRQQNTRCTCRDQGAFISTQISRTVNTDTRKAKRRRALVLPEEDHRDRCALRHRSRRSCLRCPRPIELYEAAVARLPPDI
jgi:hypothetical protein